MKYIYYIYISYNNRILIYLYICAISPPPPPPPPPQVFKFFNPFAPPLTSNPGSALGLQLFAIAGIIMLVEYRLGLLGIEMYHGFKRLLNPTDTSFAHDMPRPDVRDVHGDCMTVCRLKTLQVEWLTWHKCHYWKNQNIEFRSLRSHNSWNDIVIKSNI